MEEIWWNEILSYVALEGHSNDKEPSFSKENKNLKLAWDRNRV